MNKQKYHGFVKVVLTEQLVYVEAESWESAAEKIVDKAKAKILLKMKKAGFDASDPWFKLDSVWRDDK